MKNSTVQYDKLVEIVAQRIDNSIGGTTVDLLYEDVSIEDMLGIESVEDTICSPDHQFWNESVTSNEDVRTHIRRAIQLLKEKGRLQLHDVYGEYGDVVYVEVDVSESAVCPECNSHYTDVSQSFRPYGNSCASIVDVDCLLCEYSASFESLLTRR